MNFLLPVNAGVGSRLVEQSLVGMLQRAPPSISGNKWVLKFPIYRDSIKLQDLNTGSSREVLMADYI